jgi:glutathione S-transferase
MTDMKLLFAPPSPFSRKVRVVAHELGLADRIDCVSVHTLPTQAHADVVATNPLAKIPVLIRDDGTSLYDSRVITEYLLSLVPARELLPASGAARWNALRIVATSDGLLEAAIAIRYETVLRPADKLWHEWIEAQTGKIARALGQLASDSSAYTGQVNLAGIAVACTLGFLEFRFPDNDWRARHPELAAHAGTMFARPSMQSTDPAAA